jgi:hypothetical protein
MSKYLDDRRGQAAPSIGTALRAVGRAGAGPRPAPCPLRVRVASLGRLA